MKPERTLDATNNRRPDDVNRNSPEWQTTVTRALEESGHGVHGGYDITADGTVVCALDGEPIAVRDAQPAPTTGETT